MENSKLYDSELKLMELLWEMEPVSAKQLSLAAADRIGWNKNTTYTIIKKLIDKNVISRSEPGFVCTSRVNKQDVRMAETQSLIERLYDGSKKAFFAALFQRETLSEDELADLKSMIDKR
jgi:BlaI family transcriptional regulator, penicillinase repressor